MCTTRNYFTHKSKYIGLSYAAFKVVRVLFEGLGATMSRFDSGAYDTLEFLRAVSHAVGAHTDALQPSQHADSSDDDDEQLTPTAASASAAVSVPVAPAAADTPLRCCEVCLLAPIEGFALVPCGHARFRENCARRVADEGGNCSLCRAVISMVVRVFA